MLRMHDDEQNASTIIHTICIHSDVCIYANDTDE